MSALSTPSPSTKHATDGADFLAGEGNVTFADGQNFARLPLNIVDDDLPEVDEVFLVSER